MLSKLKSLFTRLWHGKPPPKVLDYTLVERVEHKLLTPNDEEYRFPELYKPPKVKFRMRAPRTPKEKPNP